uniref:TetR/AcrR family transcriptional regulator n=1 Tax=Nocardia cyriacigeorgica TaxID=135487 RepID=UPI002453AEED
MARQQERARRTRAAIIRSAAVEFGKSGYAAASLNRILEGSRATKGAMYFHFDSKEDLARAVLDTALDRYRFSADRWLARTDLGPLDVMHGMLDEIALRLEHDIIVQAEFRLIIEPDFYREVPNGGGRIIARATRALAVRAIEQGQLRADADPDRFARTLAARGPEFRPAAFGCVTYSALLAATITHDPDAIAAVVAATDGLCTALL